MNERQGDGKEFVKTANFDAANVLICFEHYCKPTLYLLCVSVALLKFVGWHQKPLLHEIQVINKPFIVAEQVLSRQGVYRPCQ